MSFIRLSYKKIIILVYTSTYTI